MFAAVLVLIIAIIFGLSTDYEIFLLSRMVEARQKGASTTEAVRVGTAHTGRIITAAAAILVVVTGAFGLSEIVMMKYIAFGMIAALILDATVIRMLLVPATMKLLGDDCWWLRAGCRRCSARSGWARRSSTTNPTSCATAHRCPRHAQRRSRRRRGADIGAAVGPRRRCRTAHVVAGPAVEPPRPGPPTPRPGAPAPAKRAKHGPQPAPEQTPSRPPPRLRPIKRRLRQRRLCRQRRRRKRPHRPARAPVRATVATAKSTRRRSHESDAEVTATSTPAAESAQAETPADEPALATVRFAPIPQPIGGSGWKTFRTPG